MAKKLARVLLVVLTVFCPGIVAGHGRRLPVAGVDGYADLPLAFEVNRGQSDARVNFLSRGAGYELFLTPTQAVLAVDAGKRASATVVRLSLRGSNPNAPFAAVERLPGTVSYFAGHDPRGWHTRVPTYGKVAYRGIYRGIDLLYYGNQRRLEFDFVVAPGADPRAIRLSIQGGDARVDAGGDLVLETPAGSLRLLQPSIYQDDGERRQDIAGGYVVDDRGDVAFRIGSYDASRPLVIDPVLSAATYLGGAGEDRGYAIAVDGTGAAYVTGPTTSVEFPAAGAATVRATSDAFVAKLDPSGRSLAYLAFLGGADERGADEGRGIAVDDTGNAYVTGTTTAPDFPVAGSPVQAASGGRRDAFVAKLDPTGSTLLYATYLGGRADDGASAIAVDASGHAYVTGETRSDDFPVSGRAPQRNRNGDTDAFVAKLDAFGSALVYSTYLGGQSADAGRGIAVTPSGMAAVAGETTSADFPTVHALQASPRGGADAFITELDPTGSIVTYSTYLGGRQNDGATSVAVDRDGHIHVAGQTASRDFPTASALQPAAGGGDDAFVAAVDPERDWLVYSTYLGGSANDIARAIAVDGTGDIFITGETASADFPTAHALHPANAGGRDAFVVALAPGGSQLTWSSYLGGAGDDVGRGIALGGGDVYVVGETDSEDVPLAGTPLQASNAGGVDAFVARLGASSAEPDETPADPRPIAAAAVTPPIAELPSLTITPITWNMIGLDSNNVNTGPNTFLVGARVRNVGSTAATNVAATFAFDSANAFINLTGPSVLTRPSLAAGASADFFFTVVVTRSVSARQTARRYHISASADGVGPVSTPIPRELYVERLISQNRNDVLSITGPTTVLINQTYTYVVTSQTPPGGYPQLSDSLTLPPSMFEILSVSATYSAPAGGTNDKVYADACGWDNVPTSPTYRQCIGPDQYAGGKAGGDITTTYTVRIVGTGSVAISDQIIDFSGSSFHYNSDYATGLIITANTAPTANNDAYAVNEDASLIVPAASGVLANDTDPESDPLIAALVSSPANGTLTFNANGSFTYTPNANFNGSDTFTYRASDGTDQSNVATVTLTVNSVNDPPDAVDDAASLAEDAGPTAIAVLVNDSTAPDTGETLTITAVTQGANGTVVITGGGSGLTYAPNANFNGTDSFTYTISDGNGGTDTATVTLTITSVNDPPDAVDDARTVAEDSGTTAIPVLANDTAAPDSGETLTITGVTQGANGTVAITGGGTGLTYTPNANFTGTDTFTYTISDGNGGTDTATVTMTVTSVNDPPDAVNDTATVAEDSGTTAIPVLANDTIAPDTGETLTITGVTQGTNGTVAITGGGTGLTYTPNANFNGSDTFTYTISDGNGGTDTATVTMTVTSVNDPPDAVNDTATVAEDSGTTAIPVLANDTIAPDTGETLTITGVTQGANGTVAITGGGTGLTYTPNANFNGSDTFTYTISDGNGGTDTATVTVTVASVNDPPDAVNDTPTVAEDSGATAIPVLANDTTAPDSGETLTITAVTQGANGTVVITGGGTGLTYTPNPDFHGIDTFTYTVSDGNGGTDTATVTVTVTSVNDPPTAVDDSATVPQNTGPTPIDVLANDGTAPDTGESLTIIGVTQGANGTVAIVNGGTAVTYTPNAGFAGPDTFTYTISDGNGGTDTATVAMTVDAVNGPPVANPDAYSVAEDGVLTVGAPGVLANDTDPDGNVLIAVLVTPTAGSLTLDANGAFVYTPSANFSGTDTFTYEASDNALTSNTATVTITVTEVNDPPTAVDDAATISEDSGPVAVPVLANDGTAPDVGETLTIVGVTQGTHGVVAITGGGSGLTYTPEPDFNGTDTFTYTVDDGRGGTDTATVTMTVTSINDPPVAIDDAVTLAEDAGPTAIDVLANDVDTEGDPLTIAIVGAPSSGSAVVDDNGTPGDPTDDFVRYTPAADFAGTNTFIYEACDPSLACDTATVTVTVTEVNDPPTAVDDVAALPEDSGAVAIPVLDNDTSAPDVGETLTITLVTQGANGSVAITGGGTGVTYTPNPDFNGADSFTYTIDDGRGGTDTATVAVTVTSVNDGPVANDDAVTLAEDAGATAIDVLANDVDTEGDPLTISITALPSSGRVVVDDNGTPGDPSDDYVWYTPDADFAGTDTFTYDACDPDLACDTATVTVTVTEVNDPPTAVDDVATVAEDEGAVAIPVLNNDTTAPDVGEALTITLVTQGAYGTVAITGGGAGLTYTPGPDFNGIDSFTYTIDDGRGGTDTATVIVTVTSVNDGPVANDDEITVAEDAGATAIDVLANDTDTEGDPLTITISGLPSHGTVTVGDNGTPADPTDDFVSYTPDADFAGTDTFTYFACDPDLACDTATVTVTVTEVNDPPIALIADENRGTPVAGDVIRLDGTPSFDPDGVVVTYVWNFGDGTVVDATTGPLASHVYAIPGRYVVSLVVVDDDGAQSAPTTTEIVISDAAKNLYVGRGGFRIGWSRHRKGIPSDRLWLSGRVNPRHIRPDLGGATLALTVNGQPIASPMTLDAGGRYASPPGVVPSLRCRVRSRNGAYRCRMKRADLRTTIGLPDVTDKNRVVTAVRLELGGTDIADPILSGLYEFDYTSRQRKATSGRFRYHRHRTLTGVYLSTKTRASQLRKGGEIVTAGGPLSQFGAKPVLPTGDVTVTVGYRPVVIPFHTLVRSGASFARSTWRYSRKLGVVPNVTRFVIDNARHRFKIRLRAETIATPRAAKVAPIIVDMPVNLAVETADGVAMNETVVELKRKFPTARRWAR